MSVYVVLKQKSDFEHFRRCILEPMRRLKKSKTLCLTINEGWLPYNFNIIEYLPKSLKRINYRVTGCKAKFIMVPNLERA
ncbi:hypothetical protein DAMA08_001250 [Martiniozyma asiatica (nom. inval.)]|nr:hypothetical protein DAMA08_001250 [Martiniozyma asiatica]